MTQSTIKERIDNELACMYQSYLHLAYRESNKQTTKEFFKDQLQHFARLICEEMTVEKRVCGSEFPGCSIKNPCDGHEGYNCAAKVTEEKAQEILKALE